MRIANLPVVMRGLDPRIHLKAEKRFSLLDCRVKPGNDRGWAAVFASAEMDA
jgi:hypothetical protein